MNKKNILGMPYTLFPKISLKMKLTTLLLIIALFKIQASTYSQNAKITLDLDAVMVMTVFNEIEARSEFKFLGNRDLIDDGRLVSVHVEKESIDKILTDLFLGSGIDYKIMDRQIILKKKTLNAPLIKSSSTKLNAEDKKQQFSVSGTIMDGNDMPLLGANILEKGTTNGAQSNFDGNFSINVANENATLIVSYVGFVTKEIPVNGKTNFSIKLIEDATSLDEVVVVGYGTKAKREITGSVAQVSGDVVKSSPSIGLDASLAGRLPGITINQRSGEPGKDGVSFLIRGRSSTGNNDPLIVIDGVADRDGLTHLDPDDIDTVTVLKDASASIYGSGAANGVVLVTTKRGAKGEAPLFSYNSNFGYVTPTRIPKTADSFTFAEAWNDLDAINGRQPTYSAEDLQKYKDGSSPLTHANTNWLDLLYKDVAYQNRHNLSVRGGKEDVAYFLSVGLADQGSLLAGSGNSYEQYNFRSNIDVNITDNFKVGFDLYGRKDKRQFSGGYQGYLWVGLRQSPTDPAIWPNGSYNAGSVAGYNPLAILKDGGYLRNENNVFSGTVKFDWKIPGVEGLSVNGFYAVDNTEQFDKNFNTPWNYTTYDVENDIYETFQSPARSNISLSESVGRSTSLTANIKVGYERLFGNHKINTFIGYEQNNTDSNNLSASRDRFDSSLLDILNSGSSNKQDQSNSGSYSKFAKQNYFGRASYGFKNKYLIDFNFRYDGSVSFPENGRFGFFPGVSAGWRVSQESFMDNVDFINELKLRASYGKTGNDFVNGSFMYIQKFLLGSDYVFNNTDVKGVVTSGLPIPNLTWETTTITNFGIDALFLKGKIGLSVDVFKNKTTDMLIARNLAIPSIVGFSAPIENAGEMENKGFEVLLNYQNDFGKLGFNASGNFSFARNKILYIDEAVNDDAPWQSVTGHPIDRLLVYHSLGFYKSQDDIDNLPYFSGQTPGIGDLIYDDTDNNGVINTLDMIPVDKSSTPEISFGLNLGMNYKAFDLSVLLQGQASAKQPVSYRFDGSGNVGEFILQDRVGPDNLNGTNPRVNRLNYWQHSNSDFWLNDASFLRLKTLEIGYSLPKEVLNKIGLKSIRLYTSGFNIFTLSKIKDHDPELSSFEGTVYPQTRVYNLGIKVTL